VEAGCTYGWRIGELLKLKVNQIDLETRVIRLHPGTTKNKDGREVTMTQTIHDLFELCIEGKSSEDYLFTRPNGMRVRDFRDAWDKARIAAGVPGLLFHDLRRTAARNFRRAGIAEGVIMKIGGWKTRSVFERYAIVSHSDIEDALQKLELRKSASKRTTSVTENLYGRDKPRLILVSSRKA
jgi:integrase